MRGEYMKNRKNKIRYVKETEYATTPSAPSMVPLFPPQPSLQAEGTWWETRLDANSPAVPYLRKAMEKRTVLSLQRVDGSEFRYVVWRLDEVAGWVIGQIREVK